MTVLLESEINERVVIGYHISNPKLFHPIEPTFFSFALPREAQTLMNKYYQKYGVAPSIDGLSKFTTDLEVLFFLRDLATVTLDEHSYKIVVDELYEMYLNRSLVNETTTILTGIKENKAPKGLIQKTVTDLSALKHPLALGEVQRGWAYEHVKAAWMDYLNRKKDPERYKDGIPYGISELDRYTNGGTRKGHITLIYGDTSSGKTRLKSNLAYNQAVLGKKVMYVTIEDPLKSMVRIWLGRASLLKTRDIENATLTADDQSLLRETCKKIYEERQLPYVVYWTGTAQVPDLRREVDTFAAKFGCLPEVLYFDYSNEAYPLRDFNNSSERYNFLFSEYRQFTSEYELPLITSLQQSRGGKQKKKEEDRGLDDIGQSHYVAPHCHVIVYIHQPDDLSLDAFLQKNRYGPRNKKMSLFAAWDIGYIGDRARLVQHSKAYEALMTTSPDPKEEASFAASPINHPQSPSEDETVDATIGVSVEAETSTPPEEE